MPRKTASPFFVALAMQKMPANRGENTNFDPSEIISKKT